MQDRHPPDEMPGDRGQFLITTGDDGRQTAQIINARTMRPMYKAPAGVILLRESDESEEPK